MIISRKKFEQELKKVKNEMWERENRERAEQNLWRAIYDLKERVDILEGKNPNECDAIRPIR